MGSLLWIQKFKSHSPQAVFLSHVLFTELKVLGQQICLTYKNTGNTYKLVVAGSPLSKLPGNMPSSSKEGAAV
jgi:hypothetical protein